MTTPSESQTDPRPGWRRQHPVACLFAVAGTVRSMLVPLIAGALAVRGPFLVFLLGMLLLGSVGIALLRYWRFRYRFAEHDLVVEEGWLYRNVRHVAFVRVQNINITRNLFHRLFGVSGMQLESASGTEPEAVMDAVSQAVIAELHERVERAKSLREQRGEKTAAEGEADEKKDREVRREIVRLGLKELVIHGLISNRGMVIVAALVGFFYQGNLAEQVYPVVLDWVDGFTERPPTELLETFGTLGWFLLGVTIFCVVLLALALLSVLYSIGRYYGFTLSVDAGNVRAEYGLFTRVAITIPMQRIQLIGLRANPFHRLFGRVAIKVETAGLTGGGENVASLRWLCPILRRDDVARVLGEVQPEVAWEAFEWRPLHSRARMRLLRGRLLLVIFAAILLAAIWGSVGWLALLLVPLILLYVRGYFRYAGWAVGSAAVAFRSGWMVRQQSVVRYPKIQVVSMSRNPFDRRWGMATLRADTAGADPTGHSVEIRFLDCEAARELRDLLEEKTRTTAFVW